MPRVVLGNTEGTVAVRSNHEEVARRLISENRELLRQLLQAPRLATPVEAKSPFSQSREKYIVWSLLIGPVFALSLWLNIVTIWSEEGLAPAPEVFVGLALITCASTTLLALLLHSVMWRLNRRY